MARSEAWWFAAALGLVGVLGAANVFIGSTDFAGVLIIGPLIASTQLTRRQTAVIAAVTMAVALLAVVLTREQAGAASALRLAAVVSASVFSIGAVRWRQHREEKLVRLARLADVAQAAILRPLPGRVGDVHLASRYESAAEEASIGGDFYEAVASPWGIRLVIGDVKGKGLGAVRTAARVLGGFRLAAFQFDRLAAVAAAVAECAADDFEDEDFVTALFVQIDGDGAVVTVNCGHHRAFVVGAGVASAWEMPLEHDPPLGLGTAYAETRWQPSARRLLLYTDGLVEARAPNGEFIDVDELIEAAEQATTVEECVAAVASLVHLHTGGRAKDDMALVAVDWSAMSQKAPDDGFIAVS